MHTNLSILIPAYNCAKTIERCLNSIFSQNIGDMEVIIVNDGSKDNTLDVLKKYEGKVSVISTENNGAATARNIGLSAAKGEFLMFLDSDDAIEAGSLSKVFEVQKKYDADIVKFGYRLINEEGKSYLPDNRFEVEECIEKSNFPAYVYENYISGIKLNSICMAVFKRSLLEGLEFRTDMRTAEDAVFSMEVYTRAHRVVVLPEPYYLYYETSAGITGNAVPLYERYRCNFIMSREIIRHLPEWNMNTLSFKLRALFRPIILTFDKIKRIKQHKKPR